VIGAAPAAGADPAVLVGAGSAVAIERIAIEWNFSVA